MLLLPIIDVCFYIIVAQNVMVVSKDYAMRNSYFKGQRNVWMSARLSAAKGPQGAANDLNAEPRARSSSAQMVFNK